MKFLAEFGSCFGGATLIPLRQEVVPPPKSRVASQSSGKLSSVHWKPALSMISEDSIVLELGSRRSDRTARSRKKARSTDTGSAPGHSDDYRKDPMLMALPAFSPTPYLF